MHDVADQIKAWADAAAPAGPAPVAKSAEVAPLAERHLRRRHSRLVAAAAVVAFVAALAGLVLAIERDSPQSVTTGPAEGTTDANPVAFEVLSVSDGYLNDLGVLRAASSAVQLAGLWEAAGATEPLPRIDFGEQVVVSITIPDDACPPVLEAFDRGGSTITPRFVEPSGACDDLLVIPRTFVVALDRSTTGSEFQLVLAGQPQFEFGETFLNIGGFVPGVAGATTAFHLSADTVAAGSTIAGTVQVYNNADQALESSTCGPYFVVVLEGAAATQLYSRPRCQEPFAVPPGISSYPVTAKATFLTCINGEGSELVPACLADGSMPTLPPGTYEAKVVTPDDAMPVEGPITVTVT